MSIVIICKNIKNEINSHRDTNVSQQQLLAVPESNLVSNRVPQKLPDVNSNNMQNEDDYAYTDGDTHDNVMSEALETNENTKASYTDYSALAEAGDMYEPEKFNSGKSNDKALNIYKQNVDKVLKGTYTSSDILIMGGTPKVFTDVGLSKLPIAISQEHVYSVAKTEQEAINEGRFNKNTNYHGLGADAEKYFG